MLLTPVVCFGNPHQSRDRQYLSLTKIKMVTGRKQKYLAIFRELHGNLCASTDSIRIKPSNDFLKDSLIFEE